MNHTELAQQVAECLWAEEAACEAVIADATATAAAKRAAAARLRVLKRVHGHLAKAHLALMTGGMVQPLSGGGPKPPQA